MEVDVAPGLTLRTNSQARLPSYFYRLSSRAQRTYLKSDTVDRFDYVATAAARNSLDSLMRVLETGNISACTTCARALTAEICRGLATPPVNVEIRGVRPRNTRGELHGLFYPYDPRLHRQPYILPWKRTAQR